VSRAVCTYPDGLLPQLELMGEGFNERAVIARVGRQVGLQLFGAVHYCIRHIQPGPAPLAGQQLADYGSLQGDNVCALACWTSPRGR
jgi:hypothetical protein